jgi:hypothetical protein
MDFSVDRILRYQVIKAGERSERREGEVEGNFSQSVFWNLEFTKQNRVPLHLA